MIDRKSGRLPLLAVSICLLLAPVGGFAADPPRPSIQGKWNGASANAKGTSYEFEPDNKAVWRRPGGPASIAYILDESATPWTLQLLGFPQGPLMTKVKICIVAVEGERLRLACATVLPTEEEMKKWPTAFDPQTTQEFVRADAAARP
jgi:hypothetical protein